MSNAKNKHFADRGHVLLISLEKRQIEDLYAFIELSEHADAGVYFFSLVEDAINKLC
ncbi:hypothetical protein [Pseudosulfitobacter sp. SM2401]|uniref:hypothetical protein n=1 Tax=Pseudosulfitobacter sp. SM2401 TaxID=3350098 RepID=UPI0036F3D547